ncbi:SLAP domain-containing protein [Lactobacillus sp. ESL0791]|uniref:SLAP domain-containing protein n=1 Tax=Lactobacillus sp. ESL0791 TaxID=2983234 RepID=UPI0023F7784B|nr:SLAP domain-containing protein [Lactobacillus sp. ESL0791]MDF7639110.1 SLAP domain-containing protein [Lactobacillus sp. ESL0791]
MGKHHEPVQVIKKAKIFKIKLKKNSKVFTKYGKSKGKKLLKKGHTYTVYGKKYYRLSKSRYIKAVNAKKINLVDPTPVNTNTSSNISNVTAPQFVTLTKNTPVYDAL